MCTQGVVCVAWQLNPRVRNSTHHMYLLIKLVAWGHVITKGDSEVSAARAGDQTWPWTWRRTVVVSWFHCVCRVLLSFYICCQPGWKKVLFVSSLSLAVVVPCSGSITVPFTLRDFSSWTSNRRCYKNKPKSLKPQTPESFSHIVAFIY